MNEYDPQYSRALPPGTLLPHNYIIERVLGEGGFGITYCCRLLHTEERAAVKEYFPSSIAHRIPKTQMVTSIENQQELFEQEKNHVLTEAGILLEFQHLEHIVGVKDILEANGTLYLVMEYINGITLKQYVKENETLPFDELSQLITPVMRDLIQIHKKGLLHRDISPDNLILGTDNQLHLIDFGSADFESTAEQDTKNVILKSGFAPPEQYLPAGKLGAWTDVYGLCATMYFCLTGLTPAESVSRLKKDELPALSDHAQIRSWQAKVIEKGLCLHAGDRYQTIEALYQAIIIPPVEISTQKKANIRSSKDEKTLLSSHYYIQEDRTKQQREHKPHIFLQLLKNGYIIGSFILILTLLYIGLQRTTSATLVNVNLLPISETAITKTLSRITLQPARQEDEATTETQPASNSSASPSGSSNSASGSSDSPSTDRAPNEKKTSSEKSKKKTTEEDTFITLPDDDDYDIFTD